MAFDANARIALPEFVYINLDICKKKITISFKESSWPEKPHKNEGHNCPITFLKLYFIKSHI